MSEKKIKEYQSIRQLRDEIRQDIEDYRLLISFLGHKVQEGSYSKWFLDYLEEQVTKNVKTIVQLLEQ